MLPYMYVVRRDRSILPQARNATQKALKSTVRAALLLGQRAKSLPVGQHDGRVQSGDQELRSGPIARLGLL